MELKEINVSDILANFYQPRTKFDKEGIKELAESILSNGLINPISVRVWKDKYMIVAGERRWRASKIAGLKIIQAFVKTYSSDGQFMVESLIENIHREDLTPTEKGKFCLQIKKELGLKDNIEIAKVVKKPSEYIHNWVDDYEYRKKSRFFKGEHTILRATRQFPDEERKKLITFVEKKVDGKRMRTDDFEEQFVPVYKKSDEPTKKALLSGKIKVEDLKESIPEPIQLERTANDVVDDILSNLKNFKFHVDELLKEKQINISDLSKSKADKAITTSALHLKHFIYFVNALRQRGANPDKSILDLIRANGKL